MTTDPGSLANLRGLALPSPVSYWPPAPGIVIITGAFASFCVIALWWGLRVYRRNAYRRRALAELDRLANIEGGDDVLLRLSELLKRTALAAYPRDSVAGLSGCAWAGFLARTGRGIGESAFKPLEGVYSSNGALSETSRRDTFVQARRWVRSHQGTKV